jgi:RHS repeat-associated protein
VVTDASGVIKNESDYYPYGGERVITNSLENQNYKFNGKERDSETGLDYFGARYYGSNMGSWMSPDWAGNPNPVPYADFSDPQTLNLYGYVRNSPVSKIDPNGHGLLDKIINWIKGPPPAPPNVSLNRTIRVNNKPYTDKNYGLNMKPSFLRPNPTFKSAKAAATAGAKAAAQKSMKEGVEYGGRVFEISNGIYSYSDAVTQNQQNTVDIDGGGAPNVPLGTQVAGDYHTHPGGPDVDPSRASTADQFSINKESTIYNRPMVGAIATPTGEILMTTPTATLDKNQLSVVPE